MLSWLSLRKILNTPGSKMEVVYKNEYLTCEITRIYGKYRGAKI